MPKIRHLAVICMDPEKLAKFYCDVFEMKIVGRSEKRNNVFLTDGYMNLALLSQKAEGKQNGLNHFGFHVEDADLITERLKQWDVVRVAKDTMRNFEAGSEGVEILASLAQRAFQDVSQHQPRADVSSQRLEFLRPRQQAVVLAGGFRRWRVLRYKGSESELRKQLVTGVT